MKGIGNFPLQRRTNESGKLMDVTLQIVEGLAGCESLAALDDVPFDGQAPRGPLSLPPARAGARRPVRPDFLARYHH